MKGKILFVIVIGALLGLFREENLYSQPPQESSIYDVVIIGGGVSGCYCGWRLTESDSQKSVHLYEMSDRIGGRLYTVFLPGMPKIPVELGAMRFRTNNVLTYNLATELELKIEDYAPLSSDNFFYLRGKRFHAHDITSSRALPYKLSSHEKGKNPYELLIYALEQLIPDIRTISLEEWKEKSKEINFQGQSLKDVSWQNFLGSVLSSEAYQLLVDTGHVQTVNNVSMATQIPLYINQPRAKTVKIVSGFQELASTLAKKFESNGGKIHKEHRLRSINKEEPLIGNVILKLLFTDSKDQEIEVYARKVILAIPKRSLELLDQKSVLFQDSKFKENLNAVNAYPLTKLYFGYSSPWWRKLGLLSGESVSDFDLRTTHYFGTEEEAPGGDKINTNALLLASYQGARTPFWQAFTPGDPYQGLKNFHIPAGKEFVDPKTTVSTFAVVQTQRMLKALHGLNDIPDPYTVAYFDWSQDPYGGAYYNWKIGVEIDDIIKKMRKPTDLNIFICGCTFSDMQGSVEGALKTAELVLEENFDLEAPDWLPESYNLK